MKTELLGFESGIPGDDRAIHGSNLERTKPLRQSARLNYRHITVRRDIVMAQRFTQDQIRERTVAVATDLFAFEIFGLFYRARGP